MKNLMGRLTGISFPFGGISWIPPVDEQKIARKVIIFLEDRGVLFRINAAMEPQEYAMKSTLMIRTFLTEQLGECNSKSELYQSIKAMRVTCREFNSFTGEKNSFQLRPNGQYDFSQLKLAMKIGELRSIFGIHIAKICALYKINVEKELVKILPPDADEEYD